MATTDDRAPPPAAPPRPWVLLRGLTRETGHWGPFLEAFGRAAAPQPVVALDLPGNGTLWRERSPARVAPMVEALRAQLHERGLAPPYDLFAMSLGAMAGVAWAQAHPEELASAVLVNTSLRPFSPFWQRLQPGAWTTLARLAWPGTSAQEREAAVLALTSRRVGAQAAGVLLRQWAGLHEAQPVSRGNAVRQLMAAARFEAARAAPAVPLLLLASRRDRLVSPECSQALARAWGCTIAWHADAGHDLPLDDPAWVLRALQRWRASGPTARG